LTIDNNSAAAKRKNNYAFLLLTRVEDKFGD
jgi:hypothetical protein